MLKSALSCKVSRDLAEKVKWDRPNSQFDLIEKVDGFFSGQHIFEVEIEEEEILDEHLKQLKENWNLGQFPTKLDGLSRCGFLLVGAFFLWASQFSPQHQNQVFNHI